jgi:hypothetical protein
MKKPLFVLFLILPLQIFARQSAIDTAAVMLLDRMSSVIGQLGSCSFTLRTSQDVVLEYDLGIIKQLDEHEVYMLGPDKMLINSRGDKGHRGYWYNRKKLAYYSYDENNYVILDAPPNIVATIDSVHKTYGIDFPAADFFYPTFTDDLIDNSDLIIYLGTAEANGKNCFRIIARNEDMSIQIWIADDALLLPVKMVIVYGAEDGTREYEATFSNWQINPELPAAMFEFSPPPKASKISIMVQ